MNVAVAQLGARGHYALPQMLHKMGMLERFYTDICAVKGWPRLLHAVPPSLRSSGLKRLLERVPYGIPPERITAFNGFGLAYKYRLRMKQSPEERMATYLWGSDHFSELILHHGLAEADAVYGFNVGCSALYKGAKQKGRRVIMEQFGAPCYIEQQIREIEFSDLPAWGGLLKSAIAGELRRREQEAWHLADLILCPSEFTREGVIDQGGPAEKCVIVPYGVDLSRFDVMRRVPSHTGEPLRVLFVGSVGLMKGIRYLLNAMRQLQDLPIRCRVVGGWEIAPDILQIHPPPNVDFVGHVPRSEVMQEYARADVFCLPSLCEGSAMVIYEALAVGLPVITTPNAGSIVRDGQEGFVVPIRNSDAIAERLAQLVFDRQLLSRMSQAALERRQYCSIEAYAERLSKALRTLLM